MILLDFQPSPTSPSPLEDSITKRVTMDTRMGSSYACLIVGYVEHSLFRSYTGPKLHPFLRYIDDCIDAASCSHEELEQFIHFT
eukprot:g32206.t1